MSTERGSSVLCRLFTDGYVKTAALEVDHSALKTQTGQVPDGAGEVYDDVDVADVRLVYGHMTRCNKYRYSLLFCLVFCWLQIYSCEMAVLNFIRHTTRDLQPGETDTARRGTTTLTPTFT